MEPLRCKKIEVGGYMYTFETFSTDQTKSFWRCQRKNECRARIHTDAVSGEILKRFHKHTHEGSVKVIIQPRSAARTGNAKIRTRPTIGRPQPTNEARVMMDLKDLLHPLLVKDLVQSWLREDTSSFDYCGCITGTQTVEAVIFCKERGVLAGVPFANAVFHELGCSVKWHEKEGEWMQPVATVAHASGPARNLLLAERIVLNCLSRASGVASVASRIKSRLEELKWAGELAGTRKTTPGFRMVEKYALLVGGASTHRYDLSTMIMLKDNQIKISGSILKAIELSKKVGGFSQKIEVECSSEKEALEAAECGADIIMLDNFQPKELHEVAENVKKRYPRVLIEASGGITWDNVHLYAKGFIDIISTSAMIQGYSTIDFSMNV